MQYDVQFHLTIISARKNQTINGLPILEKFGETNLGVMKVTNIQISNR